MNYKGKIITTEKYIDMVGNPPGLADEDVISFSSLETKDGDPESWIGIKDFIPVGYCLMYVFYLHLSLLHPLPSPRSL